MQNKIQIIEKKKNKILLVFAFLLLLSAFGKLLVSSTLADRGQYLAQLDAEMVKLSRENRIIKEDVASNSSIVKIATESAGLGLVKSVKSIYVELAQPVAQIPNPSY